MSDAAIAEQIRFRDELGLRADRAWVISLQTDPQASSDEFGVPLLSHEIFDLQSRAENAEDVVPIVRAHGRAHPEEYGGVFIDQQRGGVVVGMFTAEVAFHAAAIRRELHPGARFIAQQVRFSMRELDSLNALILDDSQWFTTAGIVLGSLEIDVPNNRVTLSVSGGDPSVVETVTSHFDVGEMLHVWWDPDALAMLPRGSLRGRAIDVLGRPVPDLLIEAIGELGQAEPDGGVAYGTDVDGTFFIPSLAAMGWEVRALVPAPNDGWRVIGATRVVVTGNTTSFIELVVRP